MFERWRQENFFKYLRAEYALDALLEHAVEPDNPEREVPNPQWQAATARLRQLRAAITALRALYGQAAFADTRQSLRGFKLAQAELGRRLRQLLQQCRVLKKKRATHLLQSCAARFCKSLACKARVLKIAEV
jgi:hypothetical protein